MGMDIQSKDISYRKIGISTKLVAAQYSLSVAEKNVVYLALAGVNQKEPLQAGEWYVVNVDDFATLEGKIGTPQRRDNAKVALNNAVKELYERSLRFNGGEEHRWITGYKNTSATQENTIAIKWNPDLIEHLGDLKTYANLLTKDLIGIKGKYTNRILELVSQTKYRNTSNGVITIGVDEFIDMLKLEGTYTDFKYLNNYVLKPSVRELQLLGLVNIQLEYIKAGRKVVGIKFCYSWCRNG